MKKEQFNYDSWKQQAMEEALRRKRNGEKIRIDDLTRPMLKDFLENVLDIEMDEHLDEEEKQEGNRRNGKSRKKVKTTDGAFELETPRDRNGTFEPEMVAKRQTLISEEIEDKVIRLYSKGMSVRDITDHIEEMYRFTLSPSTLSAITDRVIPLLKEWQQRPLEPVYCFVWLDAMFYKVRVDGKIISRAVYVILGVNSSGLKEILGIYICEAEGARFWLEVLEDLRNRGVQDILIASIDNLKGFAEAIEMVFKQTLVQSCVVHQIRNSFKYVSYKDIRAFMLDLRTVYQANTQSQAEDNLNALEEKWGSKYPAVIKSWRDNWHKLSTMFQFPQEIRKVIYTTNIIEGFHRQVRKVTKTKGAFTSDMALLKLIYLATCRMVEKWNTPIRNWPIIASQLKIYFADRAHININRNRIY
jgi:transposase-like protein